MVFSNFETKRSATSQCQRDGGVLASVPDTVVNSYIHYLASQSSATSVWLGVECFGKKESCMNDDNTDFGFSNFRDGEPKRDKNCIYMSTVGPDSQKWSAFDCEQRFQFVCETSATPRVFYSCPQDYTEFQGSCYKIFSGPYMSRNEQSEHCRFAHGGELLTISNYCGKYRYTMCTTFPVPFLYSNRFRYDTSVRVQSPGEERTVNMKDEIRNRISAFYQKNDIRPAHIVIYRDGVSETEFQRTLFEEKNSIEDACKELDPEYKPTLTYIVVSKRHHTRFALPVDQNNPNNLAKAQNVKAGTLVEGTVTSNSYFDFFLVSHAGVMGTSRPTHYYVLHDTWAPSFAFWQTITHALTYAYVRCPKSISQPAPVMYAHLAAKRAKDYLNAYVTAYGMNLSGSNYEQFQKLNQEVQRNKELTGMIFL